MTKLIIKWALLAPVSVFMAVFARLLCPVLPLFANDEGYLPSWLWWFQTPFDSLDGDEGSWERNPGTGKWATYKRRVAWLWRNSAYGFDMRVCGIEVDPDSDNILVDGDSGIGDDPDEHEGTCTWVAYRKGQPIAWQWMYIKHYSLFGEFKCVRIGFGWKIWDDEKLREEPAQYWIYFNPVK